MPTQSLPYYVEGPLVYGLDDVQCIALAAAWSRRAEGARLHDAQENPVRFQTYAAALAFTMKCAQAGIRTDGPLRDDTT